MNAAHQAVSILLVEDDEVDVMSVKRAFKRNQITCKLVHVEDGAVALERLTGAWDDPACPFPSIILLDINMPKLNGIELLAALENQDDQRWRESSIFMLTTSESPIDKNACYEHQIAGYFVKPFDFNLFARALKSLNDFWGMSNLPTIDFQDAKKIVLVDDDRIVRSVIAKVLQKAGYEIKTAGNGTEAWDILQQFTPDLIVSDINMPEMNGWELLQRMKEHETLHAVPFILLSGDTSEAERQQAAELGADLLLPKDAGATVVRVQAKRLFNKPK